MRALGPQQPSHSCGGSPRQDTAPRRSARRLRQLHVVSAAQADVAEAVDAASPPVHTSGSNGNGSGNGAEAALDIDAPWAPEAFKLEPGVLSEVDRLSDSGEPADAFRCDGCTRAECQVGGRRRVPTSQRALRPLAWRPQDELFQRVMGHQARGAQCWCASVAGAGGVHGDRLGAVWQQLLAADPARQGLRRGGAYGIPPLSAQK